MASATPQDAGSSAAPPALRVLHVRTGGAEVDDQIARWCARERLACVSCSDSFDACVFACRAAASPVHVIFVGTDWLPSEDWVIFEYLLQAFPQAVVVAHGETAKLLEGAAARPHVICASRRAVEAVLALEVGTLLDRLRSAARGATPAAWRPSGLPSQVRELPTDELLGPGGKFPQAGAPRAEQADPERGGRGSAEFVGDDELSALLNDVDEA